MNRSSLSDFDRDRVAVTLRRVGVITQDLRREYPEAFEAPRGESAGVTTDSEPVRAPHTAA